MAVTQSRPDDIAEAAVPIESIDQRVRMHNVPWSHYEIMMAVKGDASVPRIAYLEGELELMSPSRDHEMIKTKIGHLVIAAARHFGIRLQPVGSWTVHNEQESRGVEPDECFTIGSPRLKNVPDLAIEVLWTRGGIDKLAIYAGLGVGEVWVWRRGQIDIYILTKGEYQRRDTSGVLPSLDVALVARLAVADDLDEALAELERSWTSQS